MGNRLPAQVHQRLLRLFCDMREVIVMERVDIFTSRLIFSGSLSRFLELMDVSGSGDCGSLRQQLPVQHASRVPPAAEEKPVHQILEKLLAVRVEEKRLTDVHSTLFLGVREAVGDPSSEDSMVAKVVEMAYDGGIATSECSRQFISGCFGIRLNST
ncbi:hypothetical protein WR25_06195 [Diploscapter pachys]|uniref:Uncharacterized protein n=1 Tax=Diploscapter pachys TaxID=2018661 RepID=A0A2A2KWP2_9BILA|nr:hypothetical protein WR25_06195 [Diploscapter pachys]